MTTSLTCGVKSFIYQSWLISCGRKSFPDQMGKYRDWNRGDPVLFLQQCPHSLQRKPATPRACFSQHRQLVEGGPCAKGEEGASESFLLAWRLCGEQRRWPCPCRHYSDGIRYHQVMIIAFSLKPAGSVRTENERKLYGCCEFMREWNRLADAPWKAFKI